MRNNRDRLFNKYAYQGCPGVQMEDVCHQPDVCADRGCCQSIERAATREELNTYSGQE